MLMSYKCNNYSHFWVNYNFIYNMHLYLLQLFLYTYVYLLNKVNFNISKPHMKWSSNKSRFLLLGLVNLINLSVSSYCLLLKIRFYPSLLSLIRKWSKACLTLDITCSVSLNFQLVMKLSKVVKLRGRIGSSKSM